MIRKATAALASLGVLVMGAGATGCSDLDPAPAAAPTPVLPATSTRLDQLAPCQDLDKLPTARCGALTVPLDRDDPDAGTTKVAFAMIPHTDTSQPGLGTIVPTRAARGLDHRPCGDAVPQLLQAHGDQDGDGQVGHIGRQA